MNLAHWLRRLEAAMPWPESRPAPLLARVLFVGAAIVLCGGALVARPLRDGDAGEYLLMTESLFRHGTPEVRAADVQSLARQDERANLGLGYGIAFLGYFDDARGRWYCYHFWAYPLLGLPARVLLAAIPAGGLHALPLTNALLLLLALHRVLFATPFEARRRLGLFLLLLASPLVWFVRWPHAEVMTAACVVLSLVGAQRGLRRAPILWAALGALQTPPVVLLAALLWLRACLADLRPRNVLTSSLAASTALLSPAFFYWRFGTPSLIARESTSLSNISPSRALEMLFDLNLGLLPYMPVTVLLFGVAAVLVLIRARRAPWDAALLAVLVLMALACTATGNWNHGTIGPSRYTLWFMPLLLFLVTRLGEGLSPGLAKAYSGAVGLAVVTQAIVVLAKGGLVAEADYLEHSYAARLVLRHAPALYNPSFPVFVARTTHDVAATPRPSIYVDGGACRKALVRPPHAADLRRVCGSIPSVYDRWFAEASPREWRYVNY
jgi:hypothetical protein